MSLFTTSIPESGKFVQRLGFCTIRCEGQKCPICHCERKALHQPFLYLPNVNVCALCFEDVRRKGEEYYKTNPI
jgi:hypothetical protein